jgi:hypothetical protein
LILCVGFGLFYNQNALGVMKITTDTLNGRVEGFKLCFDVQHNKASNLVEENSVTNTSEAIVCSLKVKPFMQISGRRGVPRGIEEKTKSLRLSYLAQTTACFDYEAEIRKLSLHANDRVLLLGVGEIESACSLAEPLSIRERLTIKKLEKNAGFNRSRTGTWQTPRNTIK